MISSSGGHYEQLKMLKPLEETCDVFWVTETTPVLLPADYYLKQTGLRDKLWIPKIISNFIQSLRIWRRERPDYVISTGSMIAIPMAVIAKIAGKKVIYIESFARVYDGSKTGNLMYKIADLFIVQWETLKAVYPNAVYGGSLYWFSCAWALENTSSTAC